MRAMETRREGSDRLLQAGLGKPIAPIAQRQGSDFEH